MTDDDNVIPLRTVEPDWAAMVREKRIGALLTPSGARDYWDQNAEVRADLFGSDADPLYRRLRLAYAVQLRKLESACRVISEPTGGALVAGLSNVAQLIDDRVPF